MTQLDILQQYLIQHHFNFSRYWNSIGMNDQIIVYDENNHRLWDVVCGVYTYGGKEGLLEIMGTIVENEDDEVEGWLTAQDIIQRL